MYPSKTPFLFYAHALFVGLTILACCVIGLFTGQPAAVLSVLAFQFMPQFPIIPEAEQDDEDDPGYDGKPGFGFIPPAEEDEPTQ